MAKKLSIIASHERHVHMRLRWQLRIYGALSFVLIGIVAYDIVDGQLNFFYPLLALVVGLGMGLVVSRVSRISWDRGAEKVISRFDVIGAIILAFYAIFEIYKEDLIEQFVHGPAVVATSTALLTGIMIGRVVGMSGKISRVLEEQGKQSDRLHLLR